MEYSHRYLLRFMLLVVLLVLVWGYALASDSASPAQVPMARGEVQAAWERAREAGSYRFAADITQRAIPLPTVANVGRRSIQQGLRLEGDTNLRSQEMHLTLWSEGGSVLNLEDGIEIRVEGDRGYARRGEGDWEQVPGMDTAFAPSGDFLAFLAGAQEVTRLGVETRAGIAFTRYSYRIDGPGFAAYLRSQMEEYLARKGKLPAGAGLELSSAYAEMTGTGEIWIGADGLPLRQQLWLRFPDQGDQGLEAEVTAGFSGFGSLQSGAGGTGRLDRSWPAGAALCVALLAAACLVVARRRSHAVYAAVVVAVVLSMVAVPLLQSQQAAALGNSTAAQAQQQEQNRQEAEARQALREALTGGGFDPHAAPVGVAYADAGAAPAAAASLLRSAAQAPAMAAACDLGARQVASDSTTDQDRDGLTDYQECVLGTDPGYFDADGDTLTDTLEVRGFEMGGRHWYADPLSMDSNGDGLGDVVEWWASAEGDLPGDSDGDGTPDLFDDDNDGDGVGDDLDLSPFAATAQISSTGEVLTAAHLFGKADPLSLVADGLEPGSPTFVEFQLRPTNPDHLWYAMSVLDWPQGDDDGQVRDTDGATFADVAAAAGQPWAAAAENGDVRLIPMLEILITGTPDDLPAAVTSQVTDLSGQVVLRTTYPELEKYDIIVREAGQAGAAETVKAIYVPLQLATDPASGARVAFYGKMLYQPGAEWGKAHQVRLVWSVQALVDGVCVAADAQGQCTATLDNQAQLIHTYYDDWFLTGLTVREEHGAEVAIVYEDPAADDDLESDNGLIGLVSVLDGTFLSGADCAETGAGGRTCLPAGDDGQRDYVIRRSSQGSTSHELSEVFDRLQNGAGNTIEPWGLPNRLRVVSAGYDDRDEALATTAMTGTLQVLNDAFGAVGAVTPTLLFAREERARSLDLGEQESGRSVVWLGTGLTLDMNASPAPDATGGRPVETLAGVSWAPYRRSAGGAWEAMAVGDYLDELKRRVSAEEDPASDEALLEMLVLGAHYMGLYSGILNTVEVGGQPAVAGGLGAQGLGKLYSPPATKPAQTALKLATRYILGYLFPGGAAEKVGDFVRRAFENKTATPELVGRGAVAMRDVKSLGATSNMVAGFALAASLASVGAAIAAGATHDEGLDAASAVLTLSANTLVLYVSCLTVVQSVAAKAVEMGTRAAVSSVLGTSVSKAARIGAAIGLVIAVTISLGVFLYNVFSQGLEGPALSLALAGLFASIIVSVLLFLLSLNPVGLIVVALLGLVDALIGLICKAMGKDSCFSVIGWVTEALTKAFYSYSEAVTVRVEGTDLGPLASDLLDPGAGLQAGNALVVRAPMTTTVVHEDPPESFYDAGTGSDVRHYWSLGWLRSTRFSYAFSADPADAPTPWKTEPDHMYGVDPFSAGMQMYRATASEVVVGYAPLVAGINFRPAIQLVTEYALPGVECERILGFSDCDAKTTAGRQSTDMSNLVFDVFPADLTAFYEGGWGTWIQEVSDYQKPPDTRYVHGGMWFGAPRDHDCDGLLSRAWGGNDPDDGHWDTDGDGLSDARELELRFQGVNTFLTNADSDGDKLDDGREVRLGTDPAWWDSDGDGLSDGQEVDGWDLLYGGGAVVHVTPDPLAADGDGDGMSDAAEHDLYLSDPARFPYHPGVYNPQPIALSTTLGGGDVASRGSRSYAEPGAALVYTATVRNDLDQGIFSQGVLTVSAPAALGGQTQSYPLETFGGEARDFTSTLSISQATPSASITSTVSARLLPDQPEDSLILRMLNEDLTGIALTAEGRGASVAVAPAPTGWGAGYLVAAASGGSPGDELEVVLYRAAGDVLTATQVLTSYPWPRDKQNTQSVAMGDLDADGHVDIVAGNAGQPNRAYLNNGTAYPFNGVRGSNITDDNHSTYSVALGDMDNDGDLDVVAGNYGQPNRVYLNDGDAGGWTGYDITGDVLQTSSVAVGDVDGDGDLDVVAGNNDLYGPNRLYLNGGDGATWSGYDVAKDPRDRRNNTSAVALGDMDGDGDLDLVVGNDGQVSLLFLNNGTAGPFEGVTGLSIDTRPRSTRSVALGDLDGDGDLDVAMGNLHNQDGQQNCVCLNLDGGTRWQAYDVTADKHSTTSVALGDVDGDGDLDLVAGNWGFLEAAYWGQQKWPTRLYLNDGKGGWAAGQDIVTENVNAVALGDVNGDGAPDLLLGDGTARSQDGWANRLLLNAGGTGWRETPIGSSAGLSRTPAVDMACAGNGRCLVAWEQYDGDFRDLFGAVFLPTGGEPKPFLVADLSPGHPEIDLAVASAGDGFLVAWNEQATGAAQSVMLRWVQNNGEMEPAWTFATQSPGTVSAVDVAYAGVAGGQARYLVAWDELPSDAAQPLRVRRAFVTAAGPGAPEVIWSDPARSSHTGLHVAYDPSARNGGMVALDGSESRLISVPPAGVAACSGQTGAAVAFEGLSYDPHSRGWLAAYHTVDVEVSTVSVRAFALDCTPRSEPLNLWVHGQAGLACRAEDCARATASWDGRVYWQRLDVLTIQDAQGALEQSKTDVVQVDDDEPTAAFDTDTYTLPAQADSSTVTVGGTAGDPSSPIGRVAIRIGNEWEPAAGLEAWASTLRLPPGPGSYRVQVQAFDLLGHPSPIASATIRVLDAPPQLDTGMAEGALAPARFDDAQGLWTIPLSGTVTDTGGGLSRVEVRLDPGGDGWQPAAVSTAATPAAWSVGYALPAFDDQGAAIADPSGAYTVTVRAANLAGSLMPEDGYLVRRVRVDATPPTARLTGTGGPDAAGTAALSGDLTLRGVVSDTGVLPTGVSSVEVSFTDIETAGPAPAFQPADLGSPGETATTWSIAVPEMEGFFQVDARATDLAGNTNDDRSTWGQRRGEIDTQAPRLTLDVETAGTGSTARTHYRLAATDLNLAEESVLLAPCAGTGRVERRSYDGAWYLAHGGDPARLVEVVQSCTRQGHESGPVVAEACDAFGQCAETCWEPAAPAVVAASGPLPIRVVAGQEVEATPEDVELDVAILEPADASRFVTAGEIAVSGGAYAREGLASLTVTANGTAIYDQDWAAGVITDTAWKARWKPGATGIYVLRAVVEDRAGHSMTAAEPVTVAVAIDAQPPAIGLPAAVNAQDLAGSNRIDLAGVVTGTLEVTSVEVRVEGGTWRPAVVAPAGRGSAEWHYAWALALPPRVAYAVGVRASDAAGRSSEITGIVAVDITPPAPVTITLSYTTSAGDEHLLVPGQVVTDAQELAMEWTGSADEEGVHHIFAGWTTSSEPDPAILTATDAAARRHTQAAGEAQAVYAQVGIEDMAGNRTWQQEGPYYLDAPATPDLVSDLAYHGWMASGCTLVGVDREISRAALFGSSLSAVQRLYATWSNEALRLAWTGADWEVDGDLFVYLDTAPGGAVTAYDPYAQSGPEIGFPQGLEPDYVVWVEDAGTAVLKHWTAGGWADATEWNATELYRIDTSLEEPVTDLLLPLDLLADPSELGMVAFASDEEALRLWAAMPDENPHSSLRAVSALAAGLDVSGFGLTQAYAWPVLGTGQCPSSGYPDSDLRLTLRAEPAGVVVGYRADDWLAQAPGERLDPSNLPTDVGPAALGTGDRITYTLAYANDGTQPAQDVHVGLAAQGALQLDGGVDLDLDDIPAGASGSVELKAQIAAGADPAAELLAIVSEAGHAADWLWALHPVDRDPPSGVAILVPRGTVRSGRVTVSGTAEDVSGVQQMRLAVPGTTVLCADSAPRDGVWACDWEVPAVPDGEVLRLEATAVDIHQNASPAVAAEVAVDNTPPDVITFTQVTGQALADGILAPGELMLSGEVRDNFRAAGARLCFRRSEGEQCVEVETGAAVPGDATNGLWLYPLMPTDADGITETLSVYGRDEAGNLSSVALVADYEVDTLGPQVEVTLQRQSVRLGAGGEVLAGTARDANGVARVYAVLQAPGGDTLPVEAELAGSTGWRLVLDGAGVGRETGRISIRLYARDGAGNVAGYGPYEIEVLGANALPTLDAGPDLEANEGSVVLLDGVPFHDEDSQDRHAATIDWGDGTVDAGTIDKQGADTAGAAPTGLSQPGPDGTVSGSHVYADNGLYGVEVCVADDKGEAGCNGLTVTVRNLAPRVDTGPDLTTVEGATVTLSGRWTDPAGTVDGPYRWWWDVDGDGGPESSGTGLYGEVIRTTTFFGRKGSYTVTLHVEDKEGDGASDSLVIDVRSALPPAVLGAHTVRPGEYLFCIARAYGVDPYAIADRNHLKNANLVFPGQILWIPNRPGTLPKGRVCPRQF